MSSMEPLQSDKFRPCIDLIDSLRSLGVEQDLALPAIAVIGDRSSGKSSVLEALSGVELPRDRDYTLVVKMRKAKEGDEWHGILKYQHYDNITERRIQHPQDVAKLIQEANTWEFRRSLFSLEITSATLSDLTLVDLPSINTEKSYINDKNAEGQLVEDSNPVCRTCRKKVPAKNGNTSNLMTHLQDHHPQLYSQCKIKCIIAKPETIILVVAPCDVNIATTEALKMAQKVDPDGERTLGVLTKPDLVDKVQGKTIVDIVQNKVIPIKKGLMIVRCWGQVSQMDQINKEEHFFKDHALFKPFYDDGFATLPKLAERLSQELAQHIEKYLPQLKKQIKNQLSHTNTELKRYGNAPPRDEADKLSFLNDKVTTFTQDVIRLMTGELLELTYQIVCSSWRGTVDNSGELFQLKLEDEVTQYEQKYPDRKTFEHVIKDQIKLLVEPAVLILKDVADLVNKELQKLLEDSFIGFPRLISEARSAIYNVFSRSQKAAEFLLRTQFKMEQFGVHTEGSSCSKKFGKQKKESPMTQLNSYYQVVCQRLASQIPLVIQFHMLQEASTQLQKEMLHVLKNNPDTQKLLTHDSSVSSQRTAVQGRFLRLTKAQALLSNFRP